MVQILSVLTLVPTLHGYDENLMLFKWPCSNPIRTASANSAKFVESDHADVTETILRQ